MTQMNVSTKRKKKHILREQTVVVKGKGKWRRGVLGIWDWQI